MRAALLTVAALASAVLLAGCGTQHDHRTTSTTATPNVLALGPSKMERAWFKSLRLKQSAPAATGARADKVAASILKAASVPGVQVASVNVYSTPRLGSALAPALVLAVARPAYFLRHQLKPILPHLATSQNVNAYYLRIVDGRAKPVLEWTGSSLRGAPYSEGSLYVRPGLEGCSPIVALGWNRVPPCPSK